MELSIIWPLHLGFFTKCFHGSITLIARTKHFVPSDVWITFFCVAISRLAYPLINSHTPGSCPRPNGYEKAQNICGQVFDDLFSIPRAHMSEECTAGSYIVLPLAPWGSTNLFSSVCATCSCPLGMHEGPHFSTASPTPLLSIVLPIPTPVGAEWYPLRLRLAFPND